MLQSAQAQFKTTQRSLDRQNPLTILRLRVRQVQRLADCREERPKRELVNDMTEVHELVVGVLEAHVSVAQRRDVQVGRDLFDAHAAVYPARGSVGLLVGRWAVCWLPFLLGAQREEALDAVQPASLIWCTPTRGGDYVRCGGGLWGQGGGDGFAGIEFGLG